MAKFNDNPTFDELKRMARKLDRRGKAVKLVEDFMERNKLDGSDRFLFHYTKEQLDNDSRLFI